MLHLHINRKLKDSWENYYSVSFDNFYSAFAALGDDDSWVDTLRKVYDRLSQDDFVSFVPGYHLGTPQSPVVSITMKEEPVDTQYLGFDLGENDDGQSYGILTKQTATINIMAENDTQLTCLNEIVRQTIMSNLAFFESIGYIGLSFGGSDGIEPMVDYVPEQGAVVSRRQTWSTYHEPKVTIPHTGLATDIFIHAEDVTIGGITGAVAGESQ